MANEMQQQFDDVIQKLLSADNEVRSGAEVRIITKFSLLCSNFTNSNLHETSMVNWSLVGLVPRVINDLKQMFTFQIA